jgi:hypothetical protein
MKPGVAEKWLAFSDNFVLELVLSKDGTGTLKQYAEGGRICMSMDLKVNSHNQFLMPMTGRARLFTYEQSPDGGRLIVCISMHEKRVFAKSALLIKAVCESRVNADEDLDRILRLGSYFFVTGSVECVLLFTEAARRGSVMGNLYLGNYYYPENKGRALAYYQKAAEHGIGQVELHLALAYWRGTGGIGKDSQKALLWCSRAVKHGEPAAEVFWKEIRDEQVTMSS